MVVVGGITRLTQSGLSMVSWRPLTGWLPPLDDTTWRAAFDQYKEYPQYQQVFQNMTLGQFKEIYFWEYAHRLLGRCLGLLFFLPWLYFVIRRRMTRRFVGLTFVAFLLGGLQGFVGWWMVKSGLVNDPAVSHFRLSLHLSLAMGCAMYLLWLGLAVFPGEKRSGQREMRRWIWALVGLVSVQIIYGAFMAGTRAGHMYQTFPLFNGEFFPGNALRLDPVWLNFSDNVYMINFIHRVLGWGVFFGSSLVGIMAMKRARTPSQKTRGALLIGLVLAQFLLGVAVVLAPGVPPVLGVAHQLGAFLLLASAIALLHSFTAVHIEVPPSPVSAQDT